MSTIKENFAPVPAILSPVVKYTLLSSFVQTDTTKFTDLAKQLITNCRHTSHRRYKLGRVIE
jgi:hypothetical protein